MIDSLLYVFNLAHFEAHGIHFIQTPILFWVLISANLLIFISYVLIPLALLYLVRKRKDIIFTPIFFLFAAFIVLCGIHHLIHVITFWYPIYGLESVEDMLTGLVSIGTFFALLYVLPLALKLKSPKELEEINDALSREMEDRKKAEEKLNQDEGDMITKNKDLVDTKIAILNVLEDLSIEKAKVEMARAKEEAILFSIGDGLIANDEKGNITLINKTAEKLLGMKSEEVMRRSFFETILIKDEKGVSIPLEKRSVKMALTGGTTTTTTGPAYYYVRKDKTKFPVAIMVTPIILDGKIIGTIEVFRDITQEKAIDQAKTEFVSLASHQLRTPLTDVSWHTEMILKGDLGKVIPGQKKYLEAIYQGNQRMIELVNTLLDVSRLELGTFKVEPKPTDVIVLAESVLNEQKPKIEKKKLIIIQKLSKDISTFLIDPKLLRMVFQNLLANAVEYTPSGGRIEFGISLDKDKQILIQVSDTGYGIPKNQQDKIFAKFFRADNVIAKDTDGTGLGLYIVKSIVENSGGKIWFESEENKGTTFYVTFPLALDGVKKKEDTK